MNSRKHCCPEQTQSETTQSLYRQILRIFLPANAAKQRTEETLEYCRRTGCRDVLLFTTNYDEEPSFKSLDKVSEYTNSVLKPAAERFRKAGISVGINVMQTLGHCYFPDDPEYRIAFPFQRRITADGKGDRGGACPLDAGLRQWVQKTYSIYAEVQADYIFVDDEFRTMLRDGLTCFCPLHLKRIADLAKVGTVTREEVAKAIWSEQDSPLRKAYFAATTQGLAEMAERIRQAVKSVAPEMRLGLMTQVFPQGTTGIDYEKILKALSGDERPLVRPQTSLYAEVGLRHFASAVVNPSIFRSVLPPETEHYAEIENYPYGCWAKSDAMTIAQIYALLLQGFMKQAVNFYSMFMRPFEETISLIEAQVRERPRFEALAQWIPDGSAPFGVYNYFHLHELESRQVKSPGEYLHGHALALALPNLGIPFGTRPDAPWVMLTGDALRHASRAEIDALLCRGALLDVPALRTLTELGFGERIGIRAGRELESDEIGFEEFDSHDGIDPSTQRFPLQAFMYPNQGHWYELTSTGSAQAWSLVRDFRGRIVTPALQVRENAAGERFGVLAFTGDASNHWMANRNRAKQLRQFFAWQGRTSLPLAVKEDAPYCWTIVNRDTEGRLIAGIINTSSDTIRSLPLVLAGKWLQVTGSEELPLKQTDAGVLQTQLAPLEVLILHKE